MPATNSTQTILGQLLPYFRVTLAEMGDPRFATFCVAIKVEEPIDLYYIAGFIRLNEIMPGVPSYREKEKLLCFPELIVDAECYDLIISHD